MSSEDGIDREKAEDMLDKIRNTDKRLKFEDGLGDGWIEHSTDRLWRVRMSIGNVATMFEDELVDEIVSEAIGISIQPVQTATDQTEGSQ